MEDDDEPDVEDDEGVLVGWLRLAVEPSALAVPTLELVEVVLDAWVDRVPELCVAVCPGNERAAATESPPPNTTAPAIIQRLIRVIRASPASRALVLRWLTVPIIGPTRKKTLSRL